MTRGVAYPWPEGIKFRLFLSKGLVIRDRDLCRRPVQLSRIVHRCGCGWSDIQHVRDASVGMWKKVVTTVNRVSDGFWSRFLRGNWLPCQDLINYDLDFRWRFPRNIGFWFVTHLTKWDSNIRFRFSKYQFLDRYPFGSWSHPILGANNGTVTRGEVDRIVNTKKIRVDVD